MALTRAKQTGRYLRLTLASAVAGPVVVGKIPGVALDATGADGKITIDLGKECSIFDMAVVGADGMGGSAVALGDILYKDGAEVNKDVTNGVRFGYALGAVESAATTTIEVLVGY
jgi:hypothetical protein